MSLEPVDYVNGIFSIIFICISILVGLKIAIKYREHKQTTLLYVGFTWMGMSTPWTPSAISFLSVLFTNTIPSAALLLSIGNVFLPIVLILWMNAFGELLYKDKKKLLVATFMIAAIAYYIAFFSMLAIDTELIGSVTGPTDTSYRLFVIVYQLLLLAVIGITGTLFSLKSLRADEPEIKLKGKFLIIAFYAFIIGSVFDVISGINIVILIVGRIILILAAIHFYYGFFLPSWMKELFLGEN